MSTATPRIYTPLFHWQCDRPEEYEAYYERWLGTKLKDPGRKLWHAHRHYKEKCLLDNDTFYRAIPPPERAVCTTPGVRAWRPTRNLETGHPGNGVYWPRWPLPAGRPRRTYKEEVADALVASINRPIEPVPKAKVAYIRVPIRKKTPRTFSRGRETASSSTATEALHGQTPRPGTADDHRQAPQRPMTAPAKLDAHTTGAESVQAKRPYSSRGPRIIRKPPLPKTGCRAFQRLGTESTSAPETPYEGGSPVCGRRPQTRDRRESRSSSLNLCGGRVSRPVGQTSHSTRTPTRPSETQYTEGTYGPYLSSNTAWDRETREVKLRVESRSSGGTSSGPGADENEEDEGAKMVREKLQNARRTHNYSEYRIWEQLDMDAQLVDSRFGLIAKQFHVRDQDRTLGAIRRMNAAMRMSLNIMVDSDSAGEKMPTTTRADAEAKEAAEGLELVACALSKRRSTLAGSDGNIAAALEDNCFRRLANKHDLHMSVMDYLRNVFNTIDVAGRGAIKLGNLFELFQKNLKRDTVEQAILELYPSGNLDTLIDFDGFLVWYKMFAEFT